jgi:hypothetical protein
MRGLWWALPVAAIFASGGLAAEAAAQSQGNPTLAVAGTAPAVCVFSAAQAGQASNMTLGAASSTQNVLTINQLSDPATAQLLPASITVTSTGSCNHTHRLSVATKNGGLLTSASAVGFTNLVDYVAIVSWGSSVTQLATSGAQWQRVDSSLPIGAYAGTLQIQIQISNSGVSNLPLVAGAYTDALIITFEPRI